MLVRLITKFMMTLAGYEYREPLPSIVEPTVKWWTLKWWRDRRKTAIR